MNGHSKVTRTGSSGVYSQTSHDNFGSDPRNRSSSVGNTGSATGLFSTTQRTLSNLEKLLDLLQPELRNISWEVRNEVARHLNPLKGPIGNDYRCVASRLKFSVDVIDQFAKAADPTSEMIQLCNAVSCKVFFGVVHDIGRSDVIDDLLSHLTPNSNHDHHFSTQESLEEKEILSQPFEESCSNFSKFSKQPSEQENFEEESTATCIPYEQSCNFWNSISGPSSKKKWVDFCAAMNNACPKESDHGGIEKFLCKVFKIDYDSRLDGVVRVEYFSSLLACFGPFEAGKNGCLEKMYQLINKSLSKSMDGKKHSWFAGYMNQEETDDRLKDLSPGHFLIRFSSSSADKGWFILGVKTMDDVVQIEIKRNISERVHLLAGEPFPDLPSIVERLRKEIFVEECRQLLINPCPDLPLNVNFIGYTKATRRQRGRGRGRVR